jgi:hypothetical protein
MSGIEVVGLVCAIISAFTRAAALLKKRKAKKEEPKRQRDAVERSLAIGPPTVRGEYDRDFARLGTRFARGDGAYIVPFVPSVFPSFVFFGSPL